MSLKPELFDYLDHLGSTVTMREFSRRPDQPDLITLRHDIDHDMHLALELAHHEHRLGLHATYYLLHTHDYFQDERFISKCRQLEAYGHEIGLHINLLTQWLRGEVDDIDLQLRDVLARLRAAGLTITTVSAHGDKACYEHGFSNYWIWRELRGDDPATSEHGRSAEGVMVDDPTWQVAYPAEHCLRRSDGARLELWCSSLEEHGLTCDAMHAPMDRYWTDSGGSWSRSDDPLQVDLAKGRHQVLMHPIWWRGPKRAIFVLSTARAGSKWLANFVDRAGSCKAVHEWTFNHRREGDGFVPDKRTGDDYMSLVKHPEIAAGLMGHCQGSAGRLRGWS